MVAKVLSFVKVYSWRSACQARSAVPAYPAYVLSDGANSVKVSGVTADKVTLKFGDDGSAQYKDLAAAGAFLESTAEAVFETEAARQNGILASL